MTKLKDLGILPKHYIPIIKNQVSYDLASGYNTAIDEIGEIDVGLDIEKLKSTIRNCNDLMGVLNAGYNHQTNNQSKIDLWIEADIDEIVKAIADNFKDLVKVGGK